VRAVRARTRRSTTALTLVVVAVGLAACSTTTTGSDAPTRRVPPSISAPLDATIDTGSGEVAVVAMGNLSDPLNTFWQVLSRAGAAAPWQVVTPPGVADNGGLVVSAAGSSGLLAGIEPSQALLYSPTALSVDEGRSWSPGLVQGGLAAVPDALAASAGSSAVALVRNGRGEVLRSTGTSSISSKVASRAVIAASAAGRACDVGTLTAVALDASEATLVGATCTAPGAVGIFESRGGTWRLVAPRLTGAVGAATTKVVRLLEVGGGIEGLVVAAEGPPTRLVGVADSTGGVWTQSPPLLLSAGDRIASTGVEPGGGFVVLVRRADRSLALELETGPGGPWQATTAPPRGTAAVVVGTGEVVDALAVDSTRFTDWRLDTSTASWTKIGTVMVPIAFGSSS
jgi:hypothetical protein